MRCDAIAMVQTICLQLWEQCSSFDSAVFSLFQPNIPGLAHSHSMTHRKFRIGGVENTGNSCIFSVMLQDFAALPQIYDSLLSRPLQKGLKESEARFATRQVVQRSLYRYIQNIRSGKQVEQTDIKILAEQLQSLGWQGHLSSAWRCFLHRLAPSLFPLPFFSVYELYETTLHCLLEQVAFLPLQIVLTGKQDSGSFFDFFASHPEFSKRRSQTLWRVSLNVSPAFLEKRFQIGSWEFSLKVVHAYKNTSFGKHVVVYRQVEGEWICCNDTQITQAVPSASDTIYTVVYESRYL